MPVARAWPDAFADRSGLRQGPARESFTRWFTGRMASWRREGGFVVVNFRDPLYRLEVPVQGTTYAGSGGLAGGAALTGKYRPLTFGHVFNIAPVYLGALDLGDGLRDTFQVHDGVVAGVDAVREKGAAFTQVDVAPVAGQYRAWPALGLFQVGATPIGTITADVRGDATPTYVFDVSRIVQRLLVQRLGFSNDELDLPAFGQLTYLQPGDAGVHVGADAALALDVIEQMLAGIGGFVASTRGRLLTVGRLDVPALPANLTLGPGMIRSVEELDLPTDLNPPARRRRVGYRRNHFPSLDLVGALSEDERLALAQDWRIAAAFAPEVAAAHILATDPPPVPTPLYEEVDAAAEAARLVALHTPARRLLRIVTDRFPGQVQIGHVAAIAAGAWPEDGLANGHVAVVTGFDERTPAQRLELTLYG